MGACLAVPPPTSLPRGFFLTHNWANARTTPAERFILLAGIRLAWSPQMDPTGLHTSQHARKSLISLREKVKGCLSRETSSGSFIPEIDGLRFVAVVAVFLFHLNAYLHLKNGSAEVTDGISSAFSALLGGGHFGVQLFFSISGLILAFPFAAHHLEGTPAVRLKHYLLRRVTRIEPPYVINLVIAFALLVVVNGHSVGDLWPHLLASLGYVHNLTFGESSLINTVAWSLELEVQFYLLAPLLTSVFAVKNKLVRRGLIVLAGCLVTVWQAVYPPSSATLFSVLQYFLVGFLIADIYIADWKRAPALHWRWDMISLLAWAVVALISCAASTLKPLLPIGVLFAYLGAFRGTWCNRFLRNGWLVIIGGMCYSIYLYHPFVISFLGRILLRFEFGAVYWIQFLLFLSVIGPITLAACAVFFVLFEKPFMRRDWVPRLGGLVRRIIQRPVGTPPGGVQGPPLSDAMPPV